MPPTQVFPQSTYYKRSERYQDSFDTRSVISEPPISRTIVLKEVPLGPCAIPEQPPTFIRKYRTTKTTTTTQPILSPPMVFDQFNQQQNFYQAQQQQHQQHHQNQHQQFETFNHLPKDDYILETNKINQQFQNMRSSSIPPNQRCQFNYDDNMNNGNIMTSSTITQPGSTTTRYFTSKNYTTNNDQQNEVNNIRASSTPRHIIEKKSKSEQYQNDTTSFLPSSSQTAFQQRQQQSSSSTANSASNTTSNININSTRTLPFNYNQQQQTSGGVNNMGTLNSNAGGSISSSCIDYSNTHYNTDWAMRHGLIEKPVTPVSVPTSTPTIIPIYQQQPANNSNSVINNQMKVR